MEMFFFFNVIFSMLIFSMLFISKLLFPKHFLIYKILYIFPISIYENWSLFSMLFFQCYFISMLFYFNVNLFQCYFFRKLLFIYIKIYIFFCHKYLSKCKYFLLILFRISFNFHSKFHQHNDTIFTNVWIIYSLFQLMILQVKIVFS